MQIFAPSVCRCHLTLLTVRLIKWVTEGGNLQEIMNVNLTFNVNKILLTLIFWLWVTWDLDRDQDGEALCVDFSLFLPYLSTHILFHINNRQRRKGNLVWIIEFCLLWKISIPEFLQIYFLPFPPVLLFCRRKELENFSRCRFVSLLYSKF